MITFGIARHRRCGPGQRQRRRLLRPAGRRRGEQRPDGLVPLAASTSRRATEGDKLEAAQKFHGLHRVARTAATPRPSAAPVGGPWAVSTAASCRPTCRPRCNDVQAYVDAGQSTPALEFLSPIKGPALEQILVEVGSGIRRAEGRRRALRQGRREAGPAARSAGLVGQPLEPRLAGPALAAGPAATGPDRLSDDGTDNRHRRPRSPRRPPPQGGERRKSYYPLLVPTCRQG